MLKMRPCASYAALPDGAQALLLWLDTAEEAKARADRIVARHIPAAAHWSLLLGAAPDALGRNERHAKAARRMWLAHARAYRRLHQFLAARIAAQLEPMVRAAYEKREAVFAKAMGWVA